MLLHKCGAQHRRLVARPPCDKNKHGQRHRNEEAIRAFFAELHDLFIKAMLSCWSCRGVLLDERMLHFSILDHVILYSTILGYIMLYDSILYYLC